MILPKLSPIIWPEPEKKNKEIDQVKELLNKDAFYIMPELHPLKPAKGRLKDLEDLFFSVMQRNKKKKPTERYKITSLFDKYKRVHPENDKLDELELLILS